jgi:Caspase domain
MAATTAAALLIGINYMSDRTLRLNGCANDVDTVMAFLVNRAGIPAASIDVATDAGPTAVTAAANHLGPESTTKAGIILALSSLALKSWTAKLGTAWIYYSGHGTSLPDDGKDELDGKDEALVPSDMPTAGIIRDDVLRGILASFNPATSVVFVVDACHSGTMGDLKYLWDFGAGPALGPAAPRLQNSLPCEPRVVMISGCMDSGVSEESYDPVRRRSEGAMTRTLFSTLERMPQLRADVFKLVAQVRTALAQVGFRQTVQLSSSYDLRTRCALPLGGTLTREPTTAMQHAPTPHAAIIASVGTRAFYHHQHVHVAPDTSDEVVQGPGDVRAAYIPNWKRVIGVAMRSSRMLR